MQIPKEQLQSSFDRMWHYARESEIREPGGQLTRFAIRPSIKMGFDVIVRTEARNLLPSVPLLCPCLDDWKEEYLRTLDDYPLPKLRNYLRRVSRSAATPFNEKGFTVGLLKALESLTAEFGDHIINDAVFMGRSFKAPCRGFAHETAEATLIAFKLIVPIHSRRSPGKDLVYWPLNLFQTQQRLYENPTDQFKFARRTRREFLPIFGTDDNLSARDESSSFRRLSPSRFFGDRGHKLQLEVEVGHETDAKGNVIRKALQPAKSDMLYDWIPWRPFTKNDGQSAFSNVVIPKNSGEKWSPQALRVGTDRENPTTRSGSTNDLVSTLRNSLARPMDDVPLIKNRIKTGQVSLVAEEDLERTTFVDEMFAKCVESKLQQISAVTPRSEAISN